MAILPISIVGAPVLHTPARVVDVVDSSIRQLVADMYETMDLAPGVGLAAPQVGVGLRIFVYSYEDDDGNPWRGEVLNPELWMTPPPAGEPDDELESEGCLSFPGERYPLRRAEQVRLTGMDVNGQRVELYVEGWRARILQHEYDHLEGTLYIDRVDSIFDRAIHRTIRKNSWGKPGQNWIPGVEDLEG